jgi:ribonuclease R
MRSIVFFHATIISDFSECAPVPRFNPANPPAAPLVPFDVELPTPAPTPPPPTSAPLYVGPVQAHPDGFGFLSPDDGSKKDIFLGAETMRNALNGDIVSVRMTGVDTRGRKEGEIVEVLKRAFTHTVGTVFKRDNTLFVVARDTRIAQDIVLPNKAALGAAQVGDIVDVEITRYPSAELEPQGQVVDVLGGATDDGIEIEVALRQFDLPHKWPDAVLKLESKLPKKVKEADISADRRDLRALPFVTIDGETAKDFDDAVWAEKMSNGFRAIVAIADVSHYVKLGDAIDVEARERSTSVYFPRRVIPMLPEALSNELCSLKPKVDRLVLACELDFSIRGLLRRYTFYPAVIHSHARLTYDQVWAWLSGAEAPTEHEHIALLPNLKVLQYAYTKLRKKRERRGAMEFETAETIIEFSEDGKIESVHPTERNEAHKIIEEFMLQANEAAALYLLDNKAPTLFRNHEGPTPEKLENLRAFLARYNIHLGGGMDPQPVDYGALTQMTANRTDAKLIHTLILRSMQQARYSPNNLGHFGLAYDAYTHFTSPIRRYPDLVVHRAIKGELTRKRQSAGDLVALGEHTSSNERRADEASRAVMNYLKCVYMRDHVGKTYTGTVSGVQSFGLFVTLDGMGIDGLVHVSTLPQDFYKYDQIGQRLEGEKRKRLFQLSQKLQVKVVRADPDALKIDFMLDDAEQ